MTHVRKGQSVLVDMRSPEKYRDYHLSGFQNYPLRNFTTLLMEMNAKSENNKKIVVISDDIEDLKMAKKYAIQYGFDSIKTHTYQQAMKMWDES